MQDVFVRDPTFSDISVDLTITGFNAADASVGSTSVNVTTKSCHNPTGGNYNQFDAIDLSAVFGTNFDLRRVVIEYSTPPSGPEQFVLKTVTLDDIKAPSISPEITSATYDASTGTLVVTGTDFPSAAGAANDIIANRFTLTGEGGTTHTLTDTANVEITSATSFTLSLSASDRASVNLFVNRNGTTSTGGTTYNLAAAEDWAAGAAPADNIADALNGLTASNIAVPAITSATYDASTGSLNVTGTGFLSAGGASNDIVANRFTFVGEGGATYTLTDTANVEVVSSTSFTLSLSATDRANVNLIANRNGISSTGGTTYNLAAAEDWAAGADAAVTVADTTGNGITVSNVAVPAITSASYDANAGSLFVTGTGFLSFGGPSNDIVANRFTFVGEGGATYTLTDTANVEVVSSTSFTLSLSATDRANVNLIANRNGISSTGGTTYNLAAAEDWAAGADATVTVADTSGNGITVSNVAVPAITSASYDASTGVLTVTGTGFLSAGGPSNDIIANRFTVTGQGGGTYTLTDTANVEVTSPTSFTLALSATDRAGANTRLNKNGTTSIDATTYNLAAAEDWAAGAAAAVTVADLVGNGITVSNVAPPPTVTDGNIAISGASGTGGAYRIGDTVTATWNNTIGGDNNAGVSAVTVDFSQFGGGAAVAASESSGTWTASYTIVSGAIDATNRNVSVTATNASGNTTTADSTNATVDNVAPSVSDARIDISGASGTAGAFRIGDTVTASWDNTASGDNNSDTISGVTVDFSQFGGGAAVAASNSTGTWTATYTLTAGVIDAGNRNISVTATDNAGNATTAADSSNASVDIVQPTVSSVGVPANATYSAGQNLDFTVNTSENISVDTGGGTPRIALTVGSSTRHASYLSGSGTSALVFRYTVQAGDLDSDGIALGASIDLNSGTLSDDVGNSLNTTLNSVDTTANVLVDAVAPSVSSVSVPADATYLAGQNLDFTVNLAENVSVNTGGGEPRIGLTIGTLAREAVYLSGTGTSALVFRYTVQAGDEDDDGIELGPLSLSGGSIQDAAGNGLNLTLNNVGSTTAVLVDASAPAVSSVAVPAADTYGAGENLDFTVNASENVTVTGTPRIALTIGAASRFADYVSGSGSSALLFRYVVQAGELDGDGISVGALDPNGSALEDGVGNALDTTLNGVGDTTAVLVDAVAPAGHSVSFDDASINAAEATVTSFSFADAEVGADFSWTISSSGGGTPVAGTGSIAAADQQVSGIDVSGLADGTLSLSVTLTDSAGNSASAVTDSASLDKTAPAGHSVSFADGTITSGETGAVSFSFASAEVGADFSWTISSSGGGTPVSGTGTVASGSDTVSGIDVGGLNDGTLTLSVTLTDTAGNSAAAVTDSATLDSGAPDGHSVNFADGTINAVEAVGISFSLADAEIGADFSWTISSSGGGAPVTGNGTVATGSDVVGGIDVSALADGTLTISLILTDGGGNTAPAVTDTAILDQTAPEATLVLDDTRLVADETAGLTITFSEAVSGFDLADLTPGSGTLSAPASSDGGTTWTATLTPPADTVANGNTVTLSLVGVTDQAGNPGSGTASSNSYDVHTRRYTVGGTVSGLEGSGLILRNNGGDDLAVGSNGGFTFSTPLADGESYLVTVSTQPSEQNCEVGQGSGSIAAANVTTVVITCNDLVNVPGAPTAVTATPGDQQINVSWAAPADDGGSPITGYRATATLVPGLNLGAAGVGASCTTTGATQCSILGLVNGTPYLVRVVALNANGEGASGSAAAAVTPVGAPAAPTAITVQRAADSATVSWAAPANDGGSPITSYTVIAQPGGASCTASGNPPPTSCTVSGLNPNLQYTFSVTASNSAGAGDPGTAVGVGNLPVPRVVPVNSPLTLLVLAIASLLMAWRRLGRQSLAQDLGRSSKGGER